MALGGRCGAMALDRTSMAASIAAEKCKMAS
jgi:hypothetical protein